MNEPRDDELTREVTCKDYLQVRHEGGREVTRALRYYNLEAILAVGFRVRSPRGTQFRQWATVHLSEFLVKGFTMDDERLRNPPGAGVPVAARCSGRAINFRIREQTVHLRARVLC